MITTYLTEYMDFKMYDALRLFTEKRPPGPYHVEGVQTFLKEYYGPDLEEEHNEYLQNIANNIRGTVFEQ